MVLSEGTTEKSQVTPPGIDPGIFRLVAQRLNHYAIPGPFSDKVTARKRPSVPRNANLPENVVHQNWRPYSADGSRYGLAAPRLCGMVWVRQLPCGMGRSAMWPPLGGMERSGQWPPPGGMALSVKEGVRR
jgi:hypothetical protein